MRRLLLSLLIIVSGCARYQAAKGPISVPTHQQFLASIPRPTPAPVAGYYHSNSLVDAIEQANFDANMNAWDAEIAAEKEQETLDAINSKLQE